mmetsp:Transcript_9813/g.14441  ORF Transcript_9813/g.14441 Transcript_9813/m.14441 type:complete len:118 (-) Transcript_9813:38-391(-)
MKLSNGVRPTIPDWALAKHKVPTYYSPRRRRSLARRPRESSSVSGVHDRRELCLFEREGKPWLLSSLPARHRNANREDGRAEAGWRLPGTLPSSGGLKKKDMSFGSNIILTNSISKK